MPAWRLLAPWRRGQDRPQSDAGGRAVHDRSWRVVTPDPYWTRAQPWNALRFHWKLNRTWSDVYPLTLPTEKGSIPRADPYWTRAQPWNDLQAALPESPADSQSKVLPTEDGAVPRPGPYWGIAQPWNVLQSLELARHADEGAPVLQPQPTEEHSVPQNGPYWAIATDWRALQQWQLFQSVTDQQVHVPVNQYPTPTRPSAWGQWNAQALLGLIVTTWADSQPAILPAESDGVPRTGPYWVLAQPWNALRAYALMPPPADAVSTGPLVPSERGSIPRPGPYWERAQPWRVIAQPVGDQPIQFVAGAAASQYPIQERLLIYGL